MSLPTPQYALPVHLCRFTVRVAARVALSGFSRQYDYLRCRLSPERVPYCRSSAREVDLPASLNAYIL